MVQPAVNDQSLDELRFAFPKRLNAIRHRIFNGECYSFDVVQRALQVACKRGAVITVAYNDWSSLLTYVDDYVNSDNASFFSSHNETTNLSIFFSSFKVI